MADSLTSRGSNGACPASRRRRFRNIAILITTFAFCSGLRALSGRAQSINSKTDQKEATGTSPEKAQGQATGSGKVIKTVGGSPPAAMSDHHPK
jgi:hypothetical protein